MSNNVVNLAEYREKKKGKAEDGLVQAMRDSLDNKKVMRRYGIKTPDTKASQDLSSEERLERIQKSIKRVNELMTQLKGEPNK